MITRQPYERHAGAQRGLFVVNGKNLPLRADDARPSSQPAPQHPDERLSQALEAARQEGYRNAEQVFYVQGWRAGVGIGLFGGAVLGMLATRFLIWLGTWVG